MTMRSLWLLWPLALLSTACLREELPVAPFERGEAATVQVSMQSDYRDQIWYDLGSRSIVSVNERTAWDLGLGCADSTPWLWLNTSCAMQVALTGSMDFDAVTDDAALSYRPDHPSGHFDSLALTAALDGQVVVIDRGYNSAGRWRGKVKFQLLGVDAEGYRFRYARLDGSEAHTVEVAKDERFNFVGFSFTTHEAVQIEPPKESYDLCFTTYTHLFYDPLLPYLVNGALLNPHQTQAGLDTAYAFAAVDREVATTFALSSRRDAIGYDWKSYSIDAGSFTVYPEQVYVLRDSEGFWYKLHFLDFYDENGQKGAPTFAVQRL